MKNLRHIVITSALALCGVALWTHAAGRLAASGDFKFQPNPLGIKASPYGQVIAIGLQGGVEADWHGLQAGGAHACTQCGSNHAGKCGSKATEPNGFIERLQFAASERTNPAPATQGLKFYLRRQTEDRLRAAYELDPTNYANYNSYHLFLTEPQVGTRPLLTNEVIALAGKTIEECLRDESDPRPALTAAAAAGNILELMFLHKDDHSVEDMKANLRVMDAAIARYQQFSEVWLENGCYENLSPARQTELVERVRFVLKVREAAAVTIARLSGELSGQASQNTY